MYFDAPRRSAWGEAISNIPVDAQAVIKILELFLKAGEVVQFWVTGTPTNGAIGGGNLLAGGFFNDPARLAQALSRTRRWHEAITIIGNPVRHSLLEAANNRLRQPVRYCASARDISRRCMLPIRFGAVATIESQVVQDRAHQCSDFLKACGWPAPLVGDLGHSIYLLYAVDLPNTAQNTERVQGVLKALAAQFDDDSVKIDLSTARADVIIPLLAISPGFTPIPQHLQPVGASLLAELAVDSNPSSEVKPVAGSPRSEADQAAINLIMAAAADVPSRQDANDDPADDRGVQRFVAESCVLDRGAWTPTGMLYDGYNAFCYLHGLYPTTASHFARKLLATFPLISERRKVHGIVTRGIRGIRLQSGGNHDVDLLW